MSAPRRVDDVRGADPETWRATLIEELENVGHEAQTGRAGHVDIVAKLLVGGLALKVDEVFRAIGTDDVKDVSVLRSKGAGIDRHALRQGERSVPSAVEAEGDREPRRDVTQADGPRGVFGEIDRGPLVRGPPQRRGEASSKGSGGGALEA
jgi:hypothetical protein